MKNMKIKGKLLTGFLLMAFLVALVGVGGIYSSMTAANQAQQISELGDLAVVAANLTSNAHEQRAAFRGAVAKDLMGSREGALADITETERLQGVFNTLLSQLQTAFAGSDGEQYVKDIQAAYTPYEGDLQVGLAAVRNQADLAELSAAIGNITTSISGVITATETLEHFGTTTTTVLADSSQESADMLLVVLIVLIAISLLGAVFMGMYNANGIANPTRKMVLAAEKLSVGDIDVEIDVESTDEIGDLAKAFQKMAQGIREQSEIISRIAQGDYTMTAPVRSDKDVMNQAINSVVDNNNNVMAELRSSSEQVSSGAAQIAQAAQNLATGTTEQAATIQEFSHSISQVQGMAEDNSRIATSALTDVAAAGKQMEECNAAIQQMLGAMHNIDESSQSISKVIKVIDDIAFQTNILALNASVEAARAGQYGKGFAVVADEVRNLALKSADAAKETSQLIEKSVSNVAEGNTIVGRVKDSVEAVGIIAGKNADSITRMNTASQEQTRSMTEISEGISQISTVVQANSATSEETAASSEEMSAQSEILNQIVTRFKLKDQALGGSRRATIAPADSGEEEPLMEDYASSYGKY